jgi:CBS domain-containing protein
MRVKDIMGAPPAVLAPDTTITAALDRLQEHRSTSLPVVDEEGALVGLVTPADLTQPEPEARERAPETVRQRLSPAVVTATPEMEVGRLAEMMRYKGLETILVVEGRRLVGALSLDEATRAA